MADLSLLSLFPATTQQILKSRQRTFAQWSRGMTLEQYLERDRIMDELEHAHNGKLITWVLAPRDDPFTLDFMCSCETFRRVGIVARPAEGQAKVTEVSCYGVASVFTPASKRNKGYAAHMMRLLHWVLAPEGSISSRFPSAWGAPPVACMQDAAFSVLYSDIGDRFYHHNCSCLPETQLGWITKGAVNTSWSVQKSIQNVVPGSGQWKWLSKEDAVQILEEDVDVMKEDATAIARGGKPVCAFLPTGGVGRFSIERVMRFDADMNPSMPMDIWGVKLITESQDEPFEFATWTLESADSKVMVLTRLRTTCQNFPGLLASITEAARQNGIETIETWNLPLELTTLATQLGGKTYDRTDHLSSIKWYGSEAEEDVQWLFNEKFSWC